MCIFWILSRNAWSRRGHHLFGRPNLLSRLRKLATRATCPTAMPLPMQFCFSVRSTISSKGKTGSPVCGKFSAFCAQEV